MLFLSNIGPFFGAIKFVLSILLAAFGITGVFDFSGGL
jgi:hypothetical protein